MAVSTNKLMDIYDPKDQACVIGYLSKINRSSGHHNFPEIIAFKCLLFCYVRESLTEKGDGMSLLEYVNGKATAMNKKTTLKLINYKQSITPFKANAVKMIKTGTNTVYGDVVIGRNEKYIYKWHIKITQTNYQWFAFSIGIDSSNTPSAFVNADFSVSGMYGNLNQFYAWGTDGKEGYKFCGTLPPKGKRYGEKVKLNDTITMVVNTKELTIEYFLNNESQGVAFSNIHSDKDYKLAISMRGLGEIRLVQFQQTFCK